MPKIVEIIGPSGSGKSTIYNSLSNEWKYEYNWVPYEKLKHSKKSLFLSLKRRINRIFNRINVLKNSQYNAPNVSSEWKVIKYNKPFLGDEYSTFKTVLMDLVEEHCRVGYNGSDKRFVTVYMMMWSIAYIDTVKSITEDNRYCILKEGEGLISRIMHLNSPSFDEKALNTYLSSIPFPDVLFFLDLEPDETLKRIQTRDRNSTLHDGMNDHVILEYTKNTYDLLSKACAIAEKSGTKVHKIDVSKPLEESVREVKDLL